MKKIKSLIDRYSSAIDKIENSELKIPKKLTKCILLSHECLNKLRIYIRENDFDSQEDEIKFYKYMKPKVYGRLKYFAYQQNFLIECPGENIQIQRAYIKKSLKKLESDKRRHLTFYQYYNHDEKSFDNKYFVRGNNQLALFSNTAHLNKDPEFSTSHDIKAAEIVAYDLIRAFYEEKLKLLILEKKKITVKEVKPKIFDNIPWTASKTDLIELIYALYASGSIKNGDAEIKKIAEVAAKLFDFHLGNVYKTYGEIRFREKDRTRFLDKLKTSLEQKMNTDDEK